MRFSQIDKDLLYISHYIGRHRQVERLAHDNDHVSLMTSYAREASWDDRLFREGKAGTKRSSEEGRRADALALRADERRDKLRKAAGRSTYPSIRGCLNGETRLCTPQSSVRESIACGGEPGELKHLSTRRKRKKHRSRK